MVTRQSQKKFARNDSEKMTWNDQAKLLRIMSNPVRLMILEALSESPKCVKSLNGLVEIVQPRLSQHMAALRRAKLVACYSCGAMRCYYVLRPTLVKRLIRLLRQEHPLCFCDRRSVTYAAKRFIKTVQQKAKK